MTRLTDILKHNLIAEQSRYIAWIPVLFGLGIGCYFLLSNEPSATIVLTLLELTLVLIYVLRKHPFFLLVSSVLLVALLGFTDIFLQTAYISSKVAPQHTEETLYLKGRIIRTDHNTKGKMRLYIDRVEGENGARIGQYRLTLQKTDAPFHEGMCIETVATLLPDTLNPLPDQYMFGRQAFFDRLSASGYTNSRVYEISCPTKPTLSDRFSFALLALRRRIASTISDVLPQEQASVAITLITGLRDGLSPEIRQNYRDSGLAHFLSISGLHMGMIATLAFFLLRLIMACFPRFATRYDTKKISAVFAIGISFFYLLLSGAQVPTQRAFLMTFLVLLGILFDRRAISMRTVAVAALVILIISPQVLIGVSFQMSFAAVVALIAFYERFASPINGFLRGKGAIRMIIAYIVGLLISSLIAALATLPYTIYHFNRIALYTSLGNLAAGPIIGLIIMPFVLITLCALPFGLYFWPLKIVGFGISTVNHITAFVSTMPQAGLNVPQLPFWGLIALTFGGLWLCIWQQRWRLLGLIPIIFGLLSPLSVRKPDILFDAKGTTLTLKSQNGQYFLLPNAKNRWLGNIWLEALHSQSILPEQNKRLKQIIKGQTTDKTLIELTCNLETCRYRNIFTFDHLGHLWLNDQPINTQTDGGGAIYIKAGRATKRSACDLIGHRPWTPCPTQGQ